MPYPFLEPGLTSFRQAVVSIVKDGSEIASVQAQGLMPRGPLPGFTIQSVPIQLGQELAPPYEVHITDAPTGLYVVIQVTDRWIKSGQQLTFDCALRISGVPH